MAITKNGLAGSTYSEPGRYGDGHGLYLQVLSENNRSWLFRYERNGRERWMGLGPLHTVDLEDARERAKRARQLLLDGTDPIEARERARQAQALEDAKRITFEKAARDYHMQYSDTWRNAKHRAQFLSTLEQYAFPSIGHLPVAGIDTPHVINVLEPIWKTKTETANRVRGRIEYVLQWATVRGYRQGENPARWKGHLSHILTARSKVAKVQHHKALPFNDVPDFMVALSAREGLAARALEFLILTAARTGEIIGARRGEIDFDAKVWTVPAERMKAQKEHRVPLSDRAVAILKALPTEGENDDAYLFPGQRKDTAISNMAMAQLLKRMGRDDITVHGFRSTFKDWASERTSYAREVTEMALAHTIGDKVEKAYRRGELLKKRTRLMRDWERYCYTPKHDATVTPIRGRA